MGQAVGWYLSIRTKQFHQLLGRQDGILLVVVTNDMKHAIVYGLEMSLGCLGVGNFADDSDDECPELELEAVLSVRDFSSRQEVEKRWNNEMQHSDGVGISSTVNLSYSVSYFCGDKDFRFEI